MDIRKVKKLIEMMEASDVSEIEIKEGEESVRISRNQVGAAIVEQPGPTSPGSRINRRTPLSRSTPTRSEPSKRGEIIQPVSRPRTETLVPKRALREENLDGDNGYTVHAPMVGTFYRASSPDASPFVEKGVKVKTGDVLCIIESMKMMNHIKADQDGIVEDILIDNGQPVEYDQPILTLS